MAGVPLNYNYNDQDQTEEDQDVQLRKQALAQIIANVQMHQQDSIYSDDRFKECRLESKMRRAFSDKNLPVIPEETEISSDEEDKKDGFFYYKPRRKRRFSIGTDKHLEQYADKKFFEAIADIRSGKYLPNNVYADSRPPQEKREPSEFEELYRQERATQTDDNDLKLLWKLARTIPAFKLADILGEFEMDNNGMFIIIRDGGALKDKYGRLVNGRGYLVDREGNVIHQNGTKIFNYDELDENGEIPAPFSIDEDEYDLLAKPNLLPKTPYKSSSRPPRPRQRKREETKKGTMNTSSNVGSLRHDRSQSKQSVVSKKFDKRVNPNSKVRPITSDTHRTQKSNKYMKRTMPLSNHFTDDKNADVTQEPSDFDSVIGLEKINVTRRQNFFTNKNDIQSEAGGIHDKPSHGFFNDFMLNERPVYFGDTSDLLSKSRKLQY